MLNALVYKPLSYIPFSTNQKDNEFYQKEGGKDQADRDFDNVVDPNTVKPDLHDNHEGLKISLIIGNNDSVLSITFKSHIYTNMLMKQVL